MAPEFIKGNLYVDFSHSIGSENFKLNYTDLLATVCNIVRKKLNQVNVKEIIANKLGLVKEKVEFKGEDIDIEIIGIITEEVTIPENDSSRGSVLYSIPFRFNKFPESEWCKIFIDSWNRPPKFTSMHRPSIAKVMGNKIVLNSTTIEEVKNYHRETLILAIEEANKRFKQNKLRKEAIEYQHRKQE